MASSRPEKPKYFLDQRGIHKDTEAVTLMVLTEVFCSRTPTCCSCSLPIPVCLCRPQYPHVLENLRGELVGLFLVQRSKPRETVSWDVHCHLKESLFGALSCARPWKNLSCPGTVHCICQIVPIPS